MAKKHEYISKNIQLLKKLTRTGDVSSKLINYYDIYQVYQGYKNVPSKMDRYLFVAEDLGMTKGKVMMAVKSMESQI